MSVQAPARNTPGSSVAGPGRSAALPGPPRNVAATSRVTIDCTTFASRAAGKSFAISTQEILLYLERGVPVFGSSSMGALRAVELEAYGMTGVGEVFEMFRDGRLRADDEVAMTFCPDTLRPLSEPMVNLRHALAACRRQGLLSASECRRVTARLKAAYFPDRTVPHLFQELREIVTTDRWDQVRDWWRASAPDLKASDARALLRMMRDQSRPSPTSFSVGQDARRLDL